MKLRFESNLANLYELWSMVETKVNITTTQLINHSLSATSRKVFGGAPASGLFFAVADLLLLLLATCVWQERVNLVNRSIIYAHSSSRLSWEVAMLRSRCCTTSLWSSAPVSTLTVFSPTISVASWMSSLWHNNGRDMKGKSQTNQGQHSCSSLAIHIRCCTASQWGLAQEWTAQQH